MSSTGKFFVGGSFARVLSTLLAGLIVISGQSLLLGASAAHAETGTPCIQSDKDDYPPGGLVSLTGGNWQPGESVHLYVNDDQGRTWERNSDVVADDPGAVSESFNLPNWFVATYKILATGQVSGSAEAAFTDSNVSMTTFPSNLTATITRTLYSSTNCTTGASPSSTGTTDVAVGSGQSLQLDAPSTGSLSGASYSFTGWSAANNKDAFAQVGSSGRSICVTGADNNGALKYVANYATASSTTTATTLSSNGSTSTYGDAVTFTATVTSTPAISGAGTVTFKDGATTICTAAAVSGNQATCTTPGLAAGTLSVGNHSVTATYNPATSGFTGSTSSALTQTVNKRPLTGSFKADNKVYDGTTAATVTTGSRSLSGGTVQGDDVSLSGGTAIFGTKAVGTAKTVTLSGATLAGAQQANYTLNSVGTATADISAKGVTVSFTV